MKIEVKSTQTTEKSGTSAKGRPYSIREQEAWATLDGEYRRLRIGLEDGAQPYALGQYALAESSFAVNQYGSLEISRVRLVAAK
jgi:hypothetical protein